MDDLDKIIDEYVTVLIKSYVETQQLTDAAEAWKTAKAKLQALISQEANRQTEQVLERLKALPNVYPEQIDGQYTHVEAIYKSVIEAELERLRSQA